MFEVSIEQIQCFRSVVEEGSYEKASKVLYKAKSAIMYSIKKLEEHLGFKLLDRTGYRVRPTDKGMDYYDYSKHLIQSYQQLHEQSQLLASGVEKKLSLSISGLVDMLPLYPIIKESMQKYPQTELRLEREILSGEELLNSGEVDLAIMEKLFNKIDFEYKIIGNINIKMVMAQDHPFIKLPKKDQTLEALHLYPQIITRSTIETSDKKFGVHDNSIHWRVNDTHSKKEIIVNQLGWGSLPEHLIKEELQNKKLVHLSWLEDDQSFPIYLARKKRKVHGEVAHFLWKHF